MTYKIFTLTDALAPRPKIPYVVEKILPAGSVSVWYGYPGSLKSALVMDMAMAVATGKNWLPNMPGSQVIIDGYKTTQTPVLWIDIDNGSDVTAERIAAFAKTYNADTSIPFFWMSYPTPTIRANDPRSMAALYAFVANLPIIPKFIVIDTLLRAANVKDENASEMDTVLNNIHKMAEDLKATLIMISHSKKENYGRAGNGLRGHSSIEGGVDAVFYVKREHHSDIVDIENQKARRKPVDPFTVRWTNISDPISEELIEARFFGEAGTSAATKFNQVIQGIYQKIIDTLEDNGAMNQSELRKKLSVNHSNFDMALNNAVKDGRVIIKPGPYNSNIYDVI